MSDQRDSPVSQTEIENLKKHITRYAEQDDPDRTEIKQEDRHPPWTLYTRQQDRIIQLESSSDYGVAVATRVSRNPYESKFWATGKTIAQQVPAPVARRRFYTQSRDRLGGEWEWYVTGEGGDATMPESVGQPLRTLIEENDLIRDDQLKEKVERVVSEYCTE